MIDGVGKNSTSISITYSFCDFALDHQLVNRSVFRTSVFEIANYKLL